MTALGVTLYRDVSSFCIAVAADPVVNTCKPDDCAGMSALSASLSSGDAFERLKNLYKYCSDSVDAHPSISRCLRECAVRWLSYSCPFELWCSGITSRPQPMRAVLQRTRLPGVTRLSAPPSYAAGFWRHTLTPRKIR